MSEIDGFEPHDVAAAERLDTRIDLVLAGRPSDGHPELPVLISAMRADPPPDLGERVVARAEEAADRRRAAAWRPFRYAAAALAYLFVSQGVGNLLFGGWIADGVGESFSPHAMREGAFALIAVGIVVAASALHRRFAPVAVASGVPLAVGLGAGGIAEIGQFAPGAVLHLTEGAVGLALLGTFLWTRRDGSARADE